jgi:protein-tyrosine phosphatase
MDSIQNFRDMGGYFTRSGKQVRWGKIYRSGDLSHVSAKDSSTLKMLGIKTIIDFRKAKRISKLPDAFAVDNYMNLPINAATLEPEIKKRIVEGSFLKGDAIIRTQDCYREIIEEFSAQYRDFFDILCDESNYPVLFHCGLGKDRTGLAAFFLLKCLDIPSDIIEDDFLLSNDCIDKPQLFNGEKSLSEKMQEAMTMISKADVSQLRYAVYCIKKKRGSIEEYMTKDLNLTGKKRDKLKAILLYQ